MRHRSACLNWAAQPSGEAAGDRGGRAQSGVAEPRSWQRGRPQDEAGPAVKGLVRSSLMTGKPQCRLQRRVVRWGRSRVWPAAGGTPGDARESRPIATSTWPGQGVRLDRARCQVHSALSSDLTSQLKSTYASCPARESQDPSDPSHPEHLRRRLTLRRGPSQFAAASCLPRWRSRMHLLDVRTTTRRCPRYVS